MWKSTFGQNYWPTFSPTVPPFAAGISRVMWTWRRLAAEIGTSKTMGGGVQGCTISLLAAVHQRHMLQALLRNRNRCGHLASQENPWTKGPGFNSALRSHMQQKSILQSPDGENRNRIPKLYIKNWTDGKYLTYQHLTTFPLTLFWDLFSSHYLKNNYRNINPSIQFNCKFEMQCTKQQLLNTLGTGHLNC
jgi:hypothetical protein